MKTLFQARSSLHHTVFAAVLLAAGTLYAADTPASSKSAKEADAGGQLTASSFIKQAAQGNACEIALSEIAERKAQSQEVKQFAQHIRQDHAAANKKLEPIAAKHGVPINQPLEAKDQSRIEELQKLSGAEFDKKFMQEMLRDHARSVSKYEKASQQIQESDVKQFAQSTLPKLQQHLQHAKQTAMTIGIEASTISSLSRESEGMGGASDEAGRESGKAGSSKPDAKP